MTVVMPLMLEHMGSTTCVHTNPVGVNFDYIQGLAQKPEVAERVREIRAELGETKLILSVSADRLYQRKY